MILRAAVAFLLMLSGVLVASPATAADLDCSDFSTQAQAQRYLTAGDPHRLDADGDGRACDSLPCPCSSGQPQPLATTATVATIRQAGRVVRVIDGDTVDVRLARSSVKRVRLLGINSPEKYTQCYGRAATRVTQRLLPVGSWVKLVSDPTQARKDRYGRLLRYVSKGTVEVNRRLVYVGAARVYVYQGKAFKRVREFRGAQSFAANHRRGLWGACR